jgi:hypothetical protein
MKPTLFANEVDGDDPSAEEYDAILDAMRRILPKRCPDCEGTGKDDICSKDGFHTGSEGKCEYNTPDPTCEGRGFFYPDMPDWWDKEPYTSWGSQHTNWQEAWEGMCDDTWRAMGVTE